MDEAIRMCAVEPQMPDSNGPTYAMALNCYRLLITKQGHRDILYEEEETNPKQRSIHFLWIGKLWISIARPFKWRGSAQHLSVLPISLVDSPIQAGSHFAFGFFPLASSKQPTYISWVGWRQTDQVGGLGEWTCEWLEAREKGHTYQIDWTANIAIHEHHQAIDEVTRKEGGPGEGHPRRTLC